MDRGALIQTFVDLYGAEHDALGEAGQLELLDRGRQWDLAPVLDQGGMLLFPHGRPADCGHQVGAVVNAVLDSGADRCVFVSVLHASSDDMEDCPGPCGRRRRSVELPHLGHPRTRYRFP